MDYNIVIYDEFKHSSILELLKNIYHSSISREQLKDKYIGNNKNIIVAESVLDHQVLGCAFYEQKDDFIRKNRVMYITYVATNTIYRKQGIATSILMKLFTIAKNLKCNSVELTSANYRTEAHNLYKKLGFTEKKTKHFIRELED